MQISKLIGKNKLFLSVVPAIAVIGSVTLSSAATTITVAQDGSGDFTTVQAALNSIAAPNTDPITVFVKKGTYAEKDTLISTKQNVTIEGEDRDSTIITWDDYNGKTGIASTSYSFTLALDADNTTLKNITIQNTHIGSNQQAVALRAKGNKTFVYNCKLDGYQDTYYLYGKGLIFTKKSIITGTIDFIFGSNRAAFDSCEILVKPIPYGGNQCVTAPSTNKDTTYGLVFFNCNLKKYNDSTPVASTVLGRPWHPGKTYVINGDSIKMPDTTVISKAVYVNCSMDDMVKAAGWDSMSTDSTTKKSTDSTWSTKVKIWFYPTDLNDAFFYEYNSTGAGSIATANPPLRKFLTEEEAANYTIEKVLAGWDPETSSGVRKSGSIRVLSGSKISIDNNRNSITFRIKTTREINAVAIFSANGKRLQSLAVSKGADGEYAATTAGTVPGKGIYFVKAYSSTSQFTTKFVITD